MIPFNLNDRIARWTVAIDVALVRPGAIAPRYANGPNLDNALDLFLAQDLVVRPGETVVAPLGIKLNIPLGYGLFILPRSGVSKKTDVRIANAPGLIDHGYKDEVGVLVWNKGEDSLLCRAGERIAQACLIETPEILVRVVPEDQINGEDRGGVGGVQDNELLHAPDRQAQIATFTTVAVGRYLQRWQQSGTASACTFTKEP